MGTKLWMDHQNNIQFLARCSPSLASRPSACSHRSHLRCSKTPPAGLCDREMRSRRAA